LTVVVVLGLSWSAEAAVPPQLTAGVDTSVQFTVDSPRSAREVYLEIGELSGVTVHFDPRVKDSLISVEIDAGSAAEAFEAIAEAAGHFWVPTDSSSIAIAEDTPQNRRELEPLVVQIFPLKHADIRDIDMLLRSLVEVRRLARMEAIGAVVVRETVAKMIVIEHLINLIDRSPGHVDFSVDVIAYTDPLTRPELPMRMAVDSYRDLRANGSFEVLVQGGLSVLRGRTGSLSVMVPTTDQADGQLTVDLSARSAQVDGVAMATIEAAIEFEPDGTLKASTEITQGETWLLPWFNPNRTTDLVVAITVHLVQSAGFSPDDLAVYWVGTESRIGVPRP